MSPSSEVLAALRGNLLNREPAPRHLLVGVSGGADSVALLRGLHALHSELPGKLEVAHFNHGTRGQASQDDATWVTQLCESLGVPCHTGTACSPSTPTPGATQLPTETAAAIRANSQRLSPSENDLRRLRLDFLRETALQRELDTVCLAQHRQDQAETILHRLARGTGLRGLAGIPEERPLGPNVRLIRPLLELNPQTLRAYLAELSQDYREDATNAETDYTRNLIRHELLPLLEQIHPRSTDNLLRLHAQVQEQVCFLNAQVEHLRSAAVAWQSPEALHLRLAPLQAAAPLLVRELCITLWDEQAWSRAGMTQQHWQYITQALQPPQAARDLPHNIRLQIRPPLLILQSRGVREDAP